MIENCFHATKMTNSKKEHYRYLYTNALHNSKIQRQPHVGKINTLRHNPTKYMDLHAEKVGIVTSCCHILCT